MYASSQVTSAGVDVYLDVQGYFTPATNSWNYAYDNDGIRTSKTAPFGATTSYTWDKTNPTIPLLLTESTGGQTTRYIYGPGGVPVEQIYGSVTYLHQDHLGSIRMLTNSSGTNIGERAPPTAKPLWPSALAARHSDTPANTPTPKPDSNTSEPATTTQKRLSSCLGILWFNSLEKHIAMQGPTRLVEPTHQVSTGHASRIPGHVTSQFQMQSKKHLGLMLRIQCEMAPSSSR